MRDRTRRPGPRRGATPGRSTAPGRAGRGRPRPRVRRSSAGRLEAAGDVRAAAERDHDCVGVERRAQDRRDVVLAARAHDDVGQPAELAAPLAHEVAQALAARVDDAVERVGRDVPGADGRLQRVAQPRRQRRRGDAIDRRTRRASAVACAMSTSRWRWMNGRSAGLSTCVNDVSSSPQPDHFMPDETYGTGRETVAADRSTWSMGDGRSTAPSIRAGRARPRSRAACRSSRSACPSSRSASPSSATSCAEGHRAAHARRRARPPVRQDGRLLGPLRLRARAARGPAQRRARADDGLLRAPQHQAAARSSTSA